MQRYKIKIEYEGTPFVGWQFQKNGQSVQEILQKAIFNFSKENVVVTGAGRTDSGVHALAQVAHFDLKKKIKEKKILPAINQNIGNKPITVLKVNKTNKKFHSRHNAKKRTYRYLMQPTIDLTCCCKKDLDTNLKIIFWPLFLTEVSVIVLIGDFAWHEDERKVEKSCVPSNSLAPFFISFIFSFLRTCQALFFCNVKGDCLFIIIY